VDFVKTPFGDNYFSMRQIRQKAIRGAGLAIVLAVIAGMLVIVKPGHEQMATINGGSVAIVKPGHLSQS
jgi:hypothetical protein